MDKTEVSEGPAGWHIDRFEQPTKPKPPRELGATRRIEVSDAFVRWGAAALERARGSGDWVDLRDAGWLLGGLNRSVVVAVLHHFQETAPAALERGLQRLGELCGALFLEHLCQTRKLRIRINPRLKGTRRDAFIGRYLTRRPKALSARLEKAFGLTLAQATKHFLAFISATEKAPDQRLSSSIFGEYEGR